MHKAREDVLAINDGRKGMKAMQMLDPATQKALEDITIRLTLLLPSLDY